jgi:hypothetical protein
MDEQEQGKRTADAEEMKSFIQRYGLAMEAWVKTHGKRPMPIVEDPVTGKLRWVNRDARKAFRKQQMKKRKTK